MHGSSKGPRVHFSIRPSARTKRCFPQKDENRPFVALRSNVYDAQIMNFAESRLDGSIRYVPGPQRTFGNTPLAASQLPGKPTFGLCIFAFDIYAAPVSV